MGTWYSYAGTRIGQGRDNAKTYFQQNPALFDELDQKLRAILFSNKKVEPAEVVEKEEEPVEV
jgi:recombination protein RecA